MDCKQGTHLISKQMVDVLQQLDNETYSRPLDVFNQSSIGQHFRHIIDFYNCLLRKDSNHVVDYCNRERNPLIEQDTQTAIAVLESINTKIKAIDEEQMIAIRTDFSSSETTERNTLPSSMGRELMYAFDHALHHLALIKIGLQVHFPDIIIDKNLGVAPSTIKHRQKSLHPST